MSLFQWYNAYNVPFILCLFCNFLQYQNYIDKIIKTTFDIKIHETQSKIEKLYWAYQLICF
jgi:hypothetical protein